MRRSHILYIALLTSSFFNIDTALRIAPANPIVETPWKSVFIPYDKKYMMCNVHMGTNNYYYVKDTTAVYVHIVYVLKI